MNKSLFLNKLLCAIAFCLVSSVAFAQAPVQPSEYVIKVTPPELDTISEGLQTQPFNKVVPLLNKLRAQVMEQQKPVEPPKQPDQPNKE